MRELGLSVIMRCQIMTSATVMSKHRSGDKDRVGEARCTEQLDIDYQIHEAFYIQVLISEGTRRGN